MREKNSRFRIFFALCAVLAVLFGATINVAAVDGDKDKWLWPVEGYYAITQRFSYSNQTIKGHQAIDIATYGSKGQKRIAFQPVIATMD